MQHDLQPGNYLIFQLESGFALLRLLAVDEGRTWHVAAYKEFFPSVESAEAAIERGDVTVSTPHIALTDRAFESTQVARIANRPLTGDDISTLNEWRNDPNGAVSDRSIRLVLGLR
jgi:hypothetical protein